MNKRAELYLRGILYFTLLIALLVCGAVAVQTYRGMAPDPAREKRALLAYGLEQSFQTKPLDARFTDADHDLLADAPTDPGKLVDPQSLAMAYVKSTSNSEGIDWDKLAKQIQTGVDRPLTKQGFISLAEELDAIGHGQVQMLIVHAPEVPYLVNHYGFIPFAIAADELGPNGHRLIIAVHPKSTIQTIADIKGHELLCTEPLSVVGYRAAIAYLAQSMHLKPNYDFTVAFSGGQKDAIISLTHGQYEIAALSSDKLRKMTKSGDVAPDEYRVVYQSEIIPRYAVGYFNTLNPQLVEKIKQAVLSYVNPPDPDDEDHPVRFVPTTYAKDFATVRAIDDAFDPRLTAPSKDNPFTPVEDSAGDSTTRKSS